MRQLKRRCDTPLLHLSQVETFRFSDDRALIVLTSRLPFPATVVSAGVLVNKYCSRLARCIQIVYWGKLTAGLYCKMVPAPPYQVGQRTSYGIGTIVVAGDGFRRCNASVLIDLDT